MGLVLSFYRVCSRRKAGGFRIKVTTRVHPSQHNAGSSERRQRKRGILVASSFLGFRRKTSGRGRFFEKLLSHKSCFGITLTTRILLLQHKTGSRERRLRAKHGIKNQKSKRNHKATHGQGKADPSVPSRVL